MISFLCSCFFACKMTTITLLYHVRIKQGRTDKALWMLSCGKCSINRRHSDGYNKSSVSLVYVVAPGIEWSLSSFGLSLECLKRILDVTARGDIYALGVMRANHRDCESC